MKAVSIDVALVFGLVIVALLALVLSHQVVHRVRRRANLVLRPAFELAVAEYLGDESASELPRAERRQERQVLRQVGLAALTELRGKERLRLTELLERTGIVADAIDELTDGRRLERRRAADMLGELRSAHSRTALVAGLDDSDRGVRLGCARALAELEDEPSTARIVALAEAEVDASPGAVSELLLVLAAWQPSVLANALRATRSISLRRILVAIVGELRLAEYAWLLRGALADRDDQMATRAARGLGLIGDDESVGALASVLADGTRAPSARAAAATSLGWIGDPTAIPGLEAASHSGEWVVRTASEHALELLGLSEAPVAVAS